MQKDGTSAQRVVGKCEATGTWQPTYAIMTQREFQRFTGALHFWCKRCKDIHKAETAALRLPAPSENP